jgi:hypothetical protein
VVDAVLLDREGAVVVGTVVGRGHVRPLSRWARADGAIGAESYNLTVT